LLVVAAAQYGTLLKLPHSLLVCVGQTAALTAILVAHGRDPARATIGMSMLFMFQVFALLTANVAARESEGRIALAKVNAELSRHRRLRSRAARPSASASRDLHDVLGHRLTA
jgi:signal transduction histidine kinase